MARPCGVCVHPERPAIDRALVAEGASLRDVAATFGLSKSAVDRHKAEHIPAALAEARRGEAARAATELGDVVAAKDDEDAAAALDVMAELRRCFERVTLLFDACDRWLRDADDPTRYDLGPRATELLVTYETVEPGTDKVARRKAPLSTLLAKVEGLPAVAGVLVVESKTADPRELVLKTADRLRAQSELLAKLLGDLDERPQIVLVNAPEWIEVRAVLLDALRPHPEARSAVAARLVALDATA